MKYSIPSLLLLLWWHCLPVAGQITGSHSRIPHRKAPAPAAANLVVSTIPAWLPQPAPYHPAAPRPTDVVHTRLDLRFDYARQYASGIATVTLRSHFAPQSTVELDAKGFIINSVVLVGKPDRPLQYTYDGYVLRVTLDHAYTRDQSYQLLISYVARPNELPAGGSEAITAARGLYFINPLGDEANKPRQIWTQGETQSNSCWFPTIDHPNQRMTQELVLTVDAQYRTLSNGLLVASRRNSDGTRTDTWRQLLPAAPYLTMLAVGNFAVVSDTYHSKAVDYYVEPKYKASAQAIFGNTPEMMDFFSKKLSVDYPWDKYAQVAVRDYVSGAMENTSATVHGAGMQLTRRELLDKTYEASESIIVHELFHQWFGDYVTCDAWSNLPLNEGFANYAQYLWAEYKYGPDAAAYEQQQGLAHYLEEADSKREPLIRYHYQAREEMFDRHSYDKAGRVLHMLRKQVGDEAFYASLNHYLSTNRLSAVEIEDLQKAFEQTTGQDLHWFFDQWFRQRGHPELEVSHAYANGQVQLRVRQVQDTVYQPVFQLPVKVTVWQKNQPTDYAITVSKTDQTFTFPAAEAPMLVKFDSDGQLLAQLDEARSQDELVFQFYHARDYLQKSEALNELQNHTDDPAVSGILRNALNDRFYAVRRLALEHLRGYHGPNPMAVKSEIVRLITADPNSSVRSQALTTLAAYKNEADAPTYLQALRDSSYQVEATAIELLARQPGTAIHTPVAALDDTPSAALLVALASYYAQRGTPAQYAWYVRRLPNLPDAELYAYLQSFGTFLARLPEADRAQGIKTLETMARTHPQYFVRLGAYKGLLNLSATQPALKETLRDIRSQETDQRLLTSYSLM